MFRQIVPFLSVLMAAEGGDGAQTAAPKEKKSPIQGKDLLIEWLGGDSDTIRERHKAGEITRQHLKAALDAAKTAKAGSGKAKVAEEIKAYLDETRGSGGGGPRRFTTDGKPLVAVTAYDKTKSNTPGVLRVASEELKIGQLYTSSIAEDGTVTMTPYTGVVVAGLGRALDDE